MPTRNSRRIRRDRAGTRQRGVCGPRRPGQRRVYRRGRKLQNQNGRSVRCGRLQDETRAAGSDRGRGRRDRRDQRLDLFRKFIRFFVHSRRSQF